MTREEVIKQLKYCKSIHNGSFGPALRIAIKSLEKTRWIPVSERLPEEGRDYLITIGGGMNFTTTSWFYHSTQTWSYPNANIVAWMPLPEPYKAESEE